MLNDITLLINQCCSSIAQDNYSSTPWYKYVYVHHTQLYNCSVPYCYSSTATLNECCSELMPYTVLAYCYWVSLHNANQCQGIIAIELV